MLMMRPEPAMMALMRSQWLRGVDVTHFPPNPPRSAVQAVPVTETTRGEIYGTVARSSPSPRAVTADPGSYRAPRLCGHGTDR